MPDYKKKNVKRAGKKRSSAQKIDDISMRSKTIRRSEAEKKKQSATQKGSLRVVKGNKLRNRNRVRVITGLVATIVAAVLIFYFSLPTGIVDQINVFSSGFGSSQFPVSMAGSNTLTVDKHGSLFYCLSDTMVEGFNSGGKRILKSQHGFSAPVMRTSATRALIFDQGGISYKVYGVNDVIIEKTTKKNIISGSIARCGAYAIATGAEGYAACVTVYNKNGEQVYEWNSSVELVSDVALSPNGKKLAVAVFSGENGVYKSKVYVLTFDSASPIHTTEYEGKFIYSLQTNINKGFFTVHSEGTDYTSWGRYSNKNFTTENSVRMYRGNSRFSLAVTTRSSDKKDNTLILFNKKGKQVSEIKWEQSITDAALVGSHIFILSDTKVYLIDKSGNTVRTGEAGFGGVRVVGISLENAIVISDNILNKVVLKSEK